METFEKIAIWTNPIWYVMIIIVLIAYGFLQLWEKIIWCDKRWYYNKWDYWMFKRQFDKGLNSDQIKNVKFWLKRKKNSPNYEKIKLLIDSCESKN